MSHTPGPWKLQGDPTIDGEIVAADDVHVVCFGHDYGEYGGILARHPDRPIDDEWSRIFKAERTANARLIAAAPDLLAAAKMVADWFTELKENQYRELVLHQTLESASRNWETMRDPSLDLSPLLKAIAKAEGVIP